MSGFFELLLGFVVRTLRSRHSLLLDNLALRQLAVLKLDDSGWMAAYSSMTGYVRIARHTTVI